METIQRQVTQPYCLPVNVSVPVWPSLQERREKIKTHARAAKDFTSQLQSLEREAVTPEVKAARARLEAKKAEVEFRCAQTQSELDQLVDQVAFQLFRRQLLTQELAELPDNSLPMVMRAFQPGEKPIRPRREILEELTESLNWLAWFSSGGDENLTREAAKVQAELAEARLLA